MFIYSRYSISMDTHMLVLYTRKVISIDGAIYAISLAQTRYSLQIQRSFFAEVSPI
jgi:hypothetical protein